jgi:hypothetical protein
VKKHRIRVRAPVDTHALNELDLYAENTSELYPQKKAILANLQKKAKKGIYDKTKAAKLWEYWTTAAARRYTKEHGAPHDTIDRLGFNKPTREALAAELATRYPEGRED